MYHLLIFFYDKTTLCCLLLYAVPSFAVLPGVLMYVFIHGGVNCLNNDSYRCYTYIYIYMYRSSPLVPLDSCLTAAACLSSAC